MNFIHQNLKFYDPVITHSKQLTFLLYKKERYKNQNRSRKMGLQFINSITSVNFQGKISVIERTTSFQL